MRKPMHWIWILLALLGGTAQAQPATPTPRDNGVAYCLGALGARERAMSDIQRQACEADPMSSACSVVDFARNVALRIRLAAYLQGRSYALSDAGLPEQASLRPGLRRGEHDQQTCLSRIQASCRHCTARGAPDEVGCINRCKAQLSACTQLDRCSDTDLLRGVP
ncbi:MAG TPA: hypothetical protein VGM87_19645 [Roseomonas sp.]